MCVASKFLELIIPRYFMDYNTIIISINSNLWG